MKNLLDAFKLIGVIEALPDEWRKSLSTRNFTAIEAFNLQNEVQLSLNGQNVLLSNAVSKTVYKELIFKLLLFPTKK